MKDINILYRLFGIRNLNQFLTTRVNPFSTFQFAKSSLFHYYTLNEIATGPDSDLFYIQNLHKRILVENLVEYNLPNDERPLGNPVYRASGINNAIRAFYFSHKQFRLFKTPYLLNKDPQALSLVNYSYIPSVYKYVETTLTEYYKWNNLFKTIFNQIETIGNTSSVNQYFFIKVPELVPGLTDFRKFTTFNHMALEIFNSPELFLIREIFNWIRKLESENILNVLTAKTLKKLHFVFYYGNKYYLLNAYYLYSFNKDNETDLKLNYKTKSELLSKIYINSLILLHSSGIMEVNPEASITEDKDEEVIDEEETDTDETETNTQGNRIKAPVLATNIKYLSDDELDDDRSEKDKEKDELDNALMEMKNNLDFLDRESKLRNIDSSVDLDEIVEKAKTTYTPHENLQNKLDQVELYKILTGGEVKALKKKMQEFPNLSDPYDPNSKLVDSIKITEEELKLDPYKDKFKDNDAILEKTMLKSTLIDFDKQYIENTLHKDILNMIQNLQHAGIIIEKYKITPIHAITGDYETHEIRVHPIDGKPSTLYFKIPIINEDGEWTVNSSKSIMRKQRGDLPIKKIKRDKVALTSYYNKVFIEREQSVKNSISEYVFKHIFNTAIQHSAGSIQNVKMNDVFDNNYDCPRLYSAIATNFSSFEIGDMHFNFDHQKLEKDIQITIPKGYYPCGTKNKSLLVMDNNDEIYSLDKDKLEPIDNMYNLLSLSKSKVPVEYNCIKIFTKDIPLAIVLGHYLGLDALLKLMKVEHSFTTDKKEMTDDKLVIKFKDTTLLIPKKQKEAISVFGGLIPSNTEKYNYKEFNKPNVYFNLLADMKLNTIYIKEMDLLKDLFVDPITLELLEKDKLPTNFINLLLKANELLVNDNHPDDLDMKYMRIKGYERIAGNIYNTLTRAVRVYKLKNNNGQGKIDLNPNEVFNVIVDDPANLLVTDINPIQILKQKEAVTYLGNGGRNRDVMNKESRRYHPNDMGIISEATVDSSDVAINTYMSANPLLNSTRGTTDRYQFDRDKATSLLSTSALLSAGSVHDDTNRVNMINIQQSHTVAAEGYRQPYVRTGYEYVIPQRLQNHFAYSANEDGVVESINDKGIIVKYSSGKKQGFNLGRVYGKAEGTVYPHQIVTLLKPNQSFKKGDNIIFNDGFFEEDILNPGCIILKNNKLVKTALYEAPETWEDSSAISQRLGKAMHTKVTKVKSIVITFDQDLKNTVKVGDKVGPLDLLTIIEDPITVKSNLFSEDSISTLKRISSNAPKSKIEGTVEKIQVFYHGVKEDMSEGLRKLADASDKELAVQCKATNKPVITGSVTDEHIVEGVPLQLDHAEIQFFITAGNEAGVGDKLVFANQLKSVIGKVMDYDMTTENGTPIDAVFGQKSIDARIVLSPEIMGTTATLLDLIAQEAVKIYRS